MILLASIHIICDTHSPRTINREQPRTSYSFLEALDSAFQLINHPPHNPHQLEDIVIKKLLAYSKKEAAAATSLSARSIDYLIEKGQLRAVKVGRRVLIPSRELERLVEKGTNRGFHQAGADPRPQVPASTQTDESAS
jgi:excisionase family DNA binding protein